MAKRAPAGGIAIVLLLAVVAVGAAGLRWALARGVGLNPDSGRYLDCAANLAAGRGYRSALFNYFTPIPLGDYIEEAISAAGVRPRTETYYLPVYPAVLSLPIAAGVSPRTAALWLTILLFALNALTVGLIVHDLTGGSPPFSVGAALIMLGAESMLYVHTMALTESLFIFLCLACLRILSRYFEAGGLFRLVGAAALCGLACLTRHIGLALVGVGAFGMVFLVRKPLPKKMPALLTFLSLGCLPLAAFKLMAYLERMRGPVLPVHLKPPAGGILAETPATLASWLLPGSYRFEAFPGQTQALSAVALAALLVLAAACAADWRRHVRAASEGAGAARRSPVLYAAFVPAFLVALLAAEAILGGLIALDIRILSPIFPPLLIIAASCLRKRLDSLPKGGLRRAVSAGLAAYVLVYVGCGIYWMAACRSQGRGYNNSAYQAPDVVHALARVRALGTIPVFTNDAGAVYFQAGRYAYQFPSRAGGEDPVVLGRALDENPACFVYYWTPAHVRAMEEGRGDRDGFEQGLITALGLQTLARSERVTVLWKPGRPRPGRRS